MKKYLLAFLLSLIFLITGIFTLSDYGINWDSPSRMLRGQAYVHFFLTGKKSYDFTDFLSPLMFWPDEYVTRFNFLAGEGEKRVSLPQRPIFKKEGVRSFYQSNIWNKEFFKLDTDHGHPPFPEILASLSNRFFYQALHLLDDLDSYSIPYILISAIGVFIVSLFAFEITHSFFASAIAGLSLALFPIFFAESHFNLKDPTQASFFAASVWAFMSWVKSAPNRNGSGLRWFFVFTIFTALTMSIKWNIVFLPFIILPWLFLIRKTDEFKAWFKIKRLGILTILGILGIFLFLVLIWPPFYQDPLSITKVFKYYLSIGVGGDSIQPAGFILPFKINAYPLILLFSQTPEIILILLLFALISRRKDSLKTKSLILLWAVVPIIRYSLPFARSYSGIRQIMEVIPAMAVLAGLGANYLSNVVIPGLTRNLYNKWIPAGVYPVLRHGAGMTITFIIFILLLIPIIHLHPNENVYFNNLVGGLKGAYHKNLLDPMITYGNIYKQAVNWINQNVPKDANVAIVDGYSFAASPMYFRDDISLSPYHFSGFEQKGEYIMSLYNSLNPSVFAYAYPRKFLNSIHTVSVDGVDLLNIYKNDPRFAKKDMANEQTLDKPLLKPVRGKDRDYFQLDLNKKVFVTRIKLQSDLKCINQNQDIIVFKPSGTVFESNEIKDLGENSVEFYFPAIDAQIIEIYPQNSNSCFIKGRVTSVGFLQK